jgi:hypothetical protein
MIRAAAAVFTGCSNPERMQIYKDQANCVIDVACDQTTIHCRSRIS